MEMVLECLSYIVVPDGTWGFNPSSNGNGAGMHWRHTVGSKPRKVSILLLMEMVLESFFYHLVRQN